MATAASAAGIERREVHLRPLPPPDWLEFDPSAEHVCVITDDDALSPRLAETLAAQGWRVALLRLPETDEAIGHALADIAATHGPIGAFVYIHHGDALDARAQVKAAFFAAKHLHAPLTAAGAQMHAGRPAFLTITRLDGALGLAQNPKSKIQNSWLGGLTGLVKTLAQEWPSVFCRVLDLAPTLAPEQAAQIILAELHDPDRRVTEVGYSESGRVTLGVES